MRARRAPLLLPWAACLLGCQPTAARHPKDGLEYVLVPAGTFHRGTVHGDTDASSDEHPRHRVEVPAFWLGRAEVTVEAFRRFVEATRRLTTAELDGWSWAVV